MAIGTEEQQLRATVRRLDRRIAANEAQAEAARVERREARRRLRALGMTWAALAALSESSTTAIHRDLQSDAARAREYEAKNRSRRVTA